MKSLVFIILCTVLKHTDAVCYNGSSVLLCPQCNGACDSENGCSCSNGIDDCVPVGSSCDPNSVDCCQMVPGLYWNSSLNCCTDEKLCSPSCKSDETCDKVGSPNCVCDKTKYQWLTIQSFKPTIICDSQTMTTSLSICQLDSLGYNYSTFHLLDDNDTACQFQYEETINDTRILSSQLKTSRGWCGNIINEDSANIYITNTVFFEPFTGRLITKNPISYNVTCKFNRNMQTSLLFAIKPVASTTNLTIENGIGSFTVTMAAYNDNYKTPLTQDEAVVIGSDIYIGIFSPDADGNLFNLMAEKCFATGTNNRSDPNSVLLITGGAAVVGDVLTTVLQNANSLEARFKFSSFKFQIYNSLYIFCDVRLCNKTAGCNLSGRSGNSDTSELGINIKFQDDINFSNSGHNTAASWALLISCLIAFVTIKVF